MKNLIKKYSGYMKNQKKEEKNLIELNKFAISNKNKLIQRDSCPLCKCKKSTFVYKAPIYNFVKCKKCELVYSKEIFKDEDVAKFYENNKIYQKSWKNHYSSLVKQKKSQQHQE